MPKERAGRAHRRAVERVTRRKHEVRSPRILTGKVQNAFENTANQDLELFPPSSLSTQLQDQQFVSTGLQTNNTGNGSHDDNTFLPEHVIWIVGCSLPHLANKRASQRSTACLGLKDCKVSWFTRKEMTWPEVLPLVSRKLQDCTYKPDAIIIHCGGNSLGKIKRGFLIKQIRSDLVEISNLAGPTTLLIWSNILPRLNWFSKIDKHEQSRKIINRAAALQVCRKGGCWIKHCEITADTPGLFRPDGINLSDIGLDIFNLSITEAVESVMSDSLKPVFE